VVLELAAAGTVAAMARALGPGGITEDSARWVFRQLADGLRYLHSRNPPLVHRDIKGANLLLTTNGLVKIADFGLARELTAGPIRDVAGTPGWMAPEVIAESDYEVDADVWSAACTLVEILEGGHPWLRNDHVARLAMLYLVCIGSFVTVAR
ncbi:kinase-like domain-containing protein, partial [Mycena pura]